MVTPLKQFSLRVLLKSAMFANKPLPVKKIQQGKNILYYIYNRTFFKFPTFLILGTSIFRFFHVAETRRTRSPNSTLMKKWAEKGFYFSGFTENNIARLLVNEI